MNALVEMASVKWKNLSMMKLKDNDKSQILWSSGFFNFKGGVPNKIQIKFVYFGRSGFEFRWLDILENETVLTCPAEISHTLF